MQHKRLWIALGCVLVVSFAVLGGMGVKIISNAPPIPREVITNDGRAVFNEETIRRGQEVWQSLGGQEIGSIWGHGSYVAPDWTADWLHREATFILDRWAKEEGGENFEALPLERKASLEARLQKLERTNTYEALTGRLTIDPVRVDAFESLSQYYSSIFSEGRNEYAIPRGALTDKQKLREMSSFFWWTSWAASTIGPPSQSRIPITGRTNRWSPTSRPAMRLYGA